ncbi:hypothetical protein IAR55_006305 [Kwoniella newhampshirensis]|uniref:C3H1-type domain-containing protein n=1 Tax=Kwoniella newhampshirensis TaxID=1651941 RepID=A0AAW0YKA8_9TREE
MLATQAEDEIDRPILDTYQPHLHLYGAIGQPSPLLPLDPGPSPGLGISRLSPFAPPFSSARTNRNPSTDQESTAMSANHHDLNYLTLGQDASAHDVDSDLAGLIAQAHRMQIEKIQGSSEEGAVQSDPSRRALDSLGGEAVPSTNDIFRTWQEDGDVAVKTGTSRFGTDKWDRGLSTATLLNKHSLGPTRSPIELASHVPPKSAPLPNFQPFSDPRLPPLTPQPHQAVGLGQHVSQGQVQNQSALYQPSPTGRAFPSSLNSNSSHPISVKFHTQSPTLSHKSSDPAAQIAAHLEGLTLALNPLLAQSDEVQELRTEVAIWKAEWGRLNDERRKLETALAQVGTAKVGPGFSAVLIDGDGLIFQESLIQAGYTGGQRAAQTLLSALPNLAASSSINSNDTGREIIVEAVGSILSSSQVNLDGKIDGQPKDIGSVIVQVFLNKSGLGSALKQTGLIPSWGVYDLFWQGFSASHELFTVIDVGGGKEASDAKIREYLKLYARNEQCEMIVLGASHDNGYANILSSLQTESRLSKLLLLKGYADLAPQLKQYSSRVVSIPDLFRTTRVPTTFSSVVASAQAVPAHVGGKQEAHAMEVDSDTTSDDAIEVIEWTTLGIDKHIKSGGTNKKQSIEVKVGKKNKYNSSLLSESRRGDDDWTETTGKKKKDKKRSKKDKDAADVVRNLDPRPCHTFYLSPWGCKNGDECAYGHDYDLNDRQLDELSRLAKSIICPFIREGRCKFSDEKCVYGHQCPNADNCVFGNTCRFYELPNGHGELD